jgi:hypothetical protein
MIPILVGVAYLRSPTGKGLVGELIVHAFAKLMLNAEEYRLMKNVTLPTEDGTTQIDHVIISAFGIFVIETKNYAGWIFGSEHGRLWTQKFPRSSHTFQNPLHQNYKHAQTLAELLGVHRGNIFSVIVFVGGGTFKTVMPANVTYASAFIRYIKSKVMPVFSAEQVGQIVDQIEAFRLTPSLKTTREHTRHVREIVAAKAEAVTPAPRARDGYGGNAMACPKCRIGTLVPHLFTQDKDGNRLKVATKLLGCSRHPMCRYSRDLTSNAQA